MALDVVSPVIHAQRLPCSTNLHERLTQIGRASGQQGLNLMQRSNMASKCSGGREN